jgi:hypothetical protein
MHGRTDFAHGHSSEKIILRGLYKQARSFGFDQNLRTLAFAGAENDGVLWGGNAMGTITAVGFPLEAELSGTKTGAQQQYRCGADNRQRNDLLPIHSRKII